MAKCELCGKKVAKNKLFCSKLCEDNHKKIEDILDMKVSHKEVDRKYDWSEQDAQKTFMERLGISSDSVDTGNGSLRGNIV